MKQSIIVAAVVACGLAGCGEQQQPAVAAAPAAASAAPSPAAKPPLVVDEAKVSEIDAKVLGEATWTGKACELKVPDGAAGLVANKGAQTVLEGYVIDPTDAPAGAFDFVLKGEKSFRIPVSTGWPRPDVAEFFKVPGLESAGFQFTTLLNAVPAGKYTVDFVIEKADGKYFCESGRSIVVR